MPRYFLQVSYNGTAFHGSQVQGDLTTVQYAINKALSMLMRTEIVSFGASRTDEGVHALCNVYHFDTALPLHPHFQYKMNAILPPALSVDAVYETVDPELNARFHALTRTYRYRIYHQKNPFYAERALFHPYQLNEEALHQMAAVIKEYTDFESFAKRASQTHTFLCTIYESKWEKHDDQLHYIVCANRFLRGMVRGLVGTQLLAGRGKISIDDFRAIIEAKDCTKADFSVTGHGLYLENIEYPEGSLKTLDLM